MDELDADPLDWLLAETGVAERDEVRRVTTFLRLLADDARAGKSEVVGCDLARARAEMDRLDRGRALATLTELLRHYLAAALDHDSFADAGTPTHSLQATWSAIERHRAAGLTMPTVPEPGESIGQGIARVRAVAETLGADDAFVRTWAAHGLHVDQGPHAAEEAWHETLAQLRSRHTLGTDGEVVAVRGVAACLLDRGAVGQACDWLDRNLRAVSCDEGLTWLASWAQLLHGDVAGAAELVRGLAPYRGRLPAPLLELRTRVPSWLRLLSGIARPSRRHGAILRDPPPTRRDFGASVLGVFALGQGRTQEVVALDVAPGLIAARAAWLVSRERACTSAGEPEQRLLVTARAWVEHRLELAEPLAPRGQVRGALGRTTARALALVPILDGDSEVAGWIHLECEHHLLPSAARLAALAEHWRDRLRAAPPLGITVAERPVTVAPAEPGLAVDDPRVEAVQTWMETLGMKMARRHWWFFEGHADEPRLVAEGGAALVDWRERLGGGHALRRAFRTAGSIVFGAADPRLARAAASGSGFAVPLAFRDQVHAVLAVESVRRGDFSPARIDAVAARAAAFAGAWRAAQFRAWHARTFGFDVFVEPQGVVGANDKTVDLQRIGAVLAPVAITGPAGAGKEILARWIHFARASLDRSMSMAAPTLVAGAEATPTSLRAIFDRDQTATLVLDDLEELSIEAQLHLRDLLDRPSDRRVRVVGLLRRRLRVATHDGSIRADLAQHFGRLELSVAPLCERRNQVPGLARVLARRFAEQEGLGRVELDDGAQALLWRQPWAGNVSELEALVYKLAVYHPGETVGADELRTLAARFGGRLLERLPSRRPKRRDIDSVLALTRKRSGAINKTRAAQYLGWDPATLAARIDALGIQNRSQASRDGTQASSRPESAKTTGPARRH